MKNSGASDERLRNLPGLVYPPTQRPAAHLPHERRRLDTSEESRGFHNRAPYHGQPFHGKSTKVKTLTKLEREAVKALRHFNRSAAGLNTVDPYDLWSVTGLLKRALPGLAAKGLAEETKLPGVWRLLPAFDAAEA